MSANDGIVVQPGDGERLSRGNRYHRILAELPELEVVDLRLARTSKACLHIVMRTRLIPST